MRGVGLREAREVTNAIDVGNAGTLMRLLPGLARGARGAGVDRRRRRVDPPPPGRPDRRAAAADGRARSRRRAGRFPPFRVYGARLRSIAYELPVASRAGEVVRAARGARRRRLDDGDRAGPLAATTRSGCSPRAGVTIHRHGRRVTVANCDELELEDVVVPGDLSSAAFADRGGADRAGLAPGDRGRGRELDADRVPADRRADGRDRHRRPRGRAGDEIPHVEPVTDLDVTAGPLVGTVVEADEVPLAIDELPLVALLGCFAEGETVVRGAGELRLKESDRIEAVVERPARPGRDDRGDRGRVRRHRHRRPARRHARRPRRPPPGDDGRGGRDGVERGRRGRRDGRRRDLVPGFTDDFAAVWAERAERRRCSASGRTTSTLGDAWSSCRGHERAPRPGPGAACSTGAGCSAGAASRLDGAPGAGCSTGAGCSAGAVASTGSGAGCSTGAGCSAPARAPRRAPARAARPEPARPRDGRRSRAAPPVRASERRAGCSAAGAGCSTGAGAGCSTGAGAGAAAGCSAAGAGCSAGAGAGCSAAGAGCSAAASRLRLVPPDQPCSLDPPSELAPRRRRLTAFACGLRRAAEVASGARRRARRTRPGTSRRCRPRRAGATACR